MGTLTNTLSFALFFAASGLLATEDAPPLTKTPPLEYIDYKNLEHEISLESLRAGNHDEKGQNQYHFKVILVALLDDEKEHLLEDKKKKHLSEAYTQFGEITLATFDHYELDKKSKKRITALVSGDRLRDLVRRAMNSWQDQYKNLSEDKIAVQVNVQLWESGKKYFILANDTQVGQAQYFALPFRSYALPLRQDTTLSMTDHKGLKATLGVHFFPAGSKKR